MSKEQQPRKFAAVIPTSLRVFSDGETGVEINLVGNDDRIMKIADADLRRAGAKRVDPKQRNSRNFGFPNWDMCNWNPEGLKKRPWMNPADPSKN